MLKKYIKLLRVKHYIKNLLIFIPMFFGGVFFDFSKLTAGMVGFWCFSFISSAIYILNDLKDIKIESILLRKIDHWLVGK